MLAILEAIRPICGSVTSLRTGQRPVAVILAIRGDDKLTYKVVYSVDRELCIVQTHTRILRPLLLNVEGLFTSTQDIEEAPPVL